MVVRVPGGILVFLAMMVAALLMLPALYEPVPNKLSIFIEDVLGAFAVGVPSFGLEAGVRAGGTDNRNFQIMFAETVFKYFDSTPGVGF
jgi:hypothetical protein